LRDAILAHPTLLEGLIPLFTAGGPVQQPRKNEEPKTLVGTR